MYILGLPCFLRFYGFFPKTFLLFAALTLIKICQQIFLLRSILTVQGSSSFKEKYLTDFKWGNKTCTISNNFTDGSNSWNFWLSNTKCEPSQSKIPWAKGKTLQDLEFIRIYNLILTVIAVHKKNLYSFNKLVKLLNLLNLWIQWILVNWGCRCDTYKTAFTALNLQPQDYLPCSM